MGIPPLFRPHRERPEKVDAAAACNAADRVVEFIGFSRVLAPLARKAAEKILGIDKQRTSLARIEHELAIVLRQIDRLEAAVLVPHHRQHVAQSAALQQRNRSMY